MYFNTSINIKLKPGLVDSYDDWPANKDDLFWFQRFIICRSLTYFNTYPLTYSPGTHMGPIQSNSTEENGTINEHMGAIKCSFQYQYTEFVLDKWQLNRLFVVVQAVHPPKTNSKLAILQDSATSKPLNGRLQGIKRLFQPHQISTAYLKTEARHALQFPRDSADPRSISRTSLASSFPSHLCRP